MLDRYGRSHTYLRISLTDRCNLRCTYCMPHDRKDWTLRSNLLTADEIERLARVFVRLGVTKIRLTGGEPTLRQDLPGIVGRLSAIAGLQFLAMTTNGLTLDRQAVELRRLGLEGLTVSLDTLRRDRFVEITKRDSFHKAWAGLEAAFAAGFSTVKLNAVMMRGVNDDELLDFVALTKDRPLHVRFIEYMPFHGTSWAEAGLFSFRDMKTVIEQAYILQPVYTEPSAVGRDFRIAGHAGTLGFVTSMTESFCSGCNRLRLTADGNIKSCLFGSGEIGLRDALRDGMDEDGMEDLIRQALYAKPLAHPPMEELLKMDNRSMVEIGG